MKQFSGNTWAVLAMMLAGLAVRWHFIGRDMQYDEAYSYLYFVSKPLSVLLSDYHFPNNHILHNLLVHGVLRFVPADAWSVRLPALLAGVLAIPLGYLAGKSLYSRTVGLWTAACMAIAWPIVDFSVNARGYTLLTCFFLLLVLLSDRQMKRPEKRLWWVWALIAALGFYTVPVMLYPVAILTVWMGMNKIPLKTLGALLAGTLLLSLLLYWPVVQRSGVLPLVLNGATKPLSPDLWVEALQRDWLQVAREWSHPLPADIGLLLFCTGVLVSGLRFFTRRREDRWPLWLAVPVAVIPLLVLHRVSPPPRIWLFLLPVAAMTALQGWHLLLDERRLTTKPWLPVLLTVLFGSWMCFSLPVSQQLSAIVRDLRPDDAVYTVSLTEPPLVFYLDTLEISYRQQRYDRELAMIRIQPGQAETPSRQYVMLPEPLDEAGRRFLLEWVAAASGRSFYVEPIVRAQHYSFWRMQ